MDKPYSSVKSSQVSQWLRSASGFKFTILIALINIVTYLFYAFQDITSVLLLDLGANFAPFTLDQEPYRLISSMFLHGYLLHLIVNMYSLFYLGVQTELIFGGLTFLRVYFFTGIVAGLSSVFFNLFTISVGASGAIFGLYGYYLAFNMEDNRAGNRPSVIINFTFYMALMFFLGEEFHFDNSAHFGGAFAGILLRQIDRIFPSGNLVGWAVMMLLVPAYLLIPKYQVEYYHAYQYLVEKDNKILSVFNGRLSDVEFLEELQKIKLLPDSLQSKFSSVSYIPPDLRPDTAFLNHYSDFRKEQIAFYIKGLSRESFIYLDSIQELGAKIDALSGFKYKLYFGSPPDKQDTLQNPAKNSEMIKQFYDENWFESDAQEAAYYRLGYKDSLGDWDGVVEDYYLSGAIQMKGRLYKGLRQGIFIYYNEDSSYVSAGRYRQDTPIGKWENYFQNGQLASEIRYVETGSVIENMWDSLGNQQVVNKNGIEAYQYPNGQVEYKRTIKDGLTEGYVESYYENGDLNYKEYYEKGELIKGIAYAEDGSKHTYDVGTLIPLPKGGYDHFYEYIKAQNSLQSDTVDGSVLLRFDVHETGQISNIRLLQRMGKPYDEYAKELLRNGPEWYPARSHGYIPILAEGEVYIDY